VILDIDPDLAATLEFMQTRIPTEKLTSVAEAVAHLGKLLWGHHPCSTIEALRLRAEPIYAQSHVDGLHIQAVASECVLRQ
jgi:hypothetical protein